MSAAVDEQQHLKVVCRTHALGFAPTQPYTLPCGNCFRHQDDDEDRCSAADCMAWHFQLKKAFFSPKFNVVLGVVWCAMVFSRHAAKVVPTVPLHSEPQPARRRYSKRQKNNGDDLQGKLAFADVVGAAQVLEVAKALRADEGGKRYNEAGPTGRWTINPEKNRFALRRHELVVALAMAWTTYGTPYAIGFETSLPAMENSPGVLFVVDVVVNLVFFAVRGCPSLELEGVCVEVSLKPPHPAATFETHCPKLSAGYAPQFLPANRHLKFSNPWSDFRGRPSHHREIVLPRELHRRFPIVFSIWYHRILSA